MQKTLLIAIDGPSSSGKGTVAKKIALHFNLPYLNTGALYRLIALRTIQAKIDPQNFETQLDFLTQNIHENDLENNELFGEDVGAVASVIAKNLQLRKKIFNFQRNFATDGMTLQNGAVLDGRDTTTVICPDATHKFYITANVEIRAKRRFDQLKKQGKNVSYEEILLQLKKRDENDLGRKDSPLLVAQDAIVIDNGNLTIEEGFQKILKIIQNERS